MAENRHSALDDGRCPHCGTDAEDQLNNAKEDGHADFYLGDDGRPSGMPTPPGAEVAGEGALTTGMGPVTTHYSKQVMLNAEMNDTVEIGHVVNGLTRIPEQYRVIRRNVCYHGTVLTLHAEIDGDDHNFRLTCPGPNTQLILWAAITAPDSPWQNGWMPIAEVTAHIAGVEQYNVCDHCDRPIKDAWHKRLSLFGACEGLERPEMNQDAFEVFGGDRDE